MKPVKFVTRVTAWIPAFDSGAIWISCRPVCASVRRHFHHCCGGTETVAIYGGSWYCKLLHVAAVDSWLHLKTWVHARRV